LLDGVIELLRGAPRALGDARDHASFATHHDQKRVERKFGHGKSVMQAIGI
jgi:hypothetical protein